MPTGGGFYNPAAGGNRGTVTLQSLQRQIQALHRIVQELRPQVTVRITGTTTTSGLYFGQILDGRTTIGNATTSPLLFGIPTLPGTVWVQNTLQSGTWGVGIPLGVVLIGSRHLNIDGNDSVLVSYTYNGTQGVGVGGGGGGGGGGPPGPPGGGGGGGGGNGGGCGDPGDTLRLLYLCSYSCSDPIGWGPVGGPWAADGSQGGTVSNGDPVNVWFDQTPGNDFEQAYWQDTGLPCDTPTEDFPPPPDPPVSTPTCP